MSVAAITLADGNGALIEPDQVATFEQAIIDDSASYLVAIFAQPGLNFGRFTGPAFFPHSTKDGTRIAYDAGIPQIQRIDTAAIGRQQLDLVDPRRQQFEQRIEFPASRLEIRCGVVIERLPLPIYARLTRKGLLWMPHQQRIDRTPFVAHRQHHV